MLVIDSAMKHLDLCNEVCMQFKDLKPSAFELKYSLPDYPSCALDSDRDINFDV